MGRLVARGTHAAEHAKQRSHDGRAARACRQLCCAPDGRCDVRGGGSAEHSPARPSRRAPRWPRSSTPTRVPMICVRTWRSPRGSPSPLRLPVRRSRCPSTRTRAAQRWRWSVFGWRRSCPTPTDPMVDMRDRYAVGDFSGALAIAEQLLAIDPSSAEALRYSVSCRDILTQMYLARPRLCDPSAARGAPLRPDSVAHPRPPFRLPAVPASTGTPPSRRSSTSAVCRASMRLRIMCELVQQNVIDVQPRK